MKSWEIICKKSRSFDCTNTFDVHTLLIVWKNFEAMYCLRVNNIWWWQGDVNPNCYTHKANTVRTFRPNGAGICFPPDRLLRICLFSSVIPVITLSELTWTNRHYRVYTHNNFVQTHMAPLGTTDGWFLSCSDAVLIRKQDMINEVWWQDAFKICGPLIKIWSGIVSLLAGLKVWLDLKPSPLHRCSCLGYCFSLNYESVGCLRRDVCLGYNVL